MKQFLTPINLNKNQIKNVILDFESGSQSTLLEGRFFYDIDDKKFKYYNDTDLITIDSNLKESLLITNDYTVMDETLDILLCNTDSNDITVELSNISLTGKKITIKKISKNNNIIINSTNSMIDNKDNLKIKYENSSVTLTYYNNWFII